MYRLYMAIAEDFWILPAGNLTDSAVWFHMFQASDFEVNGFWATKQSHMQTKTTTDGSFLSRWWWHKGHPICQTTQKTIKAFLVKGPSSTPNQLWMERRNHEFQLRNYPKLIEKVDFWSHVVQKGLSTICVRDLRVVICWVASLFGLATWCGSGPFQVGKELISSVHFESMSCWPCGF